MLHMEPLFPPTEEEDALILLEDMEQSLRGHRSPDDMTTPSPVPSFPDSPSPTSTLAQTARDDIRDLTHLAVWQVSTAKPGNGVEQLLDGSADTYWQSDGPQPHTISAQFCAKLKVSEVALYLDYGADESYTPAVVSVLAGANAHDLRLIRQVRKLDAPNGWVRIPMGENPSTLDEDEEDEDTDPELAEEPTLEEVAARNARRIARAKRREKKRVQRQRELDVMRKGKEKGVNGALQAMRDYAVTKTHMIRIVIHCNHQNGRDSHVRMVRTLGPKQQVIGNSSRFTSKQFQMYETIR